MHGDDVHLTAVLHRRVLKAALRKRYVLEFRKIDQSLRMCDVLRVEIVAFESDVRVRGGEEREAEALPESELQHPSRLQRGARCGTCRDGREGEMARRHLAIKSGRVCHVR